MPATNTPSVSVILATANRGELLGQAICSVLAQTGSEFELLVMDCGSEGETEAVVRDFEDDRIRYFYLEQADRAAACAEGIRRSRGKWLAFMDVHALWQPQFLSALTQALELAGPETGVAYAGAVIQNPAGEDTRWLPQGHFPQGRVARDLFAGPCIAPASLLVQSSLIQPLCQSTQRFWLHNDDVMSLWLSAKTAFVPVKQRLLILRVMDGHQARGLDPLDTVRGDALIRAMSELPGMVPGRYGRRCLARFHGRCADHSASTGQVGAAFGSALRALLYTPFSVSAWSRVLKMAVGA
ncbi:MAG: glycosyltransferase family 2 protein [Halomonadaceae bacterium]|nr:MAG: glycosyltransferase family 2 protein [Halomonadaceae bacterium]